MSKHTAILAHFTNRSGKEYIVIITDGTPPADYVKPSYKVASIATIESSEAFTLLPTDRELSEAGA